jgi:hypothetical protein
MDTEPALLSDTSILDSSVDSVDSVVLHQRERNKLLATMALNAQNSDPSVGTGVNRLPLGPPRPGTSTSPTNQLNQSSVDEITDTLDHVSLNTHNKGFQVIQPSKPRYLSQTLSNISMSSIWLFKEILMKCKKPCASCLNT